MTAVQPSLKCTFCRGEVDPANANVVKTELPPPFFDVAGELRPVAVVFWSLICMHGEDDTFAPPAAADVFTSLRISLADEAATLALGGALAACLTASLAANLTAGLVIFLEGDLGAGKTTLVRGLLRALGFQGRVKSPTYALVELYSVSRLNLYHFDFYRFDEPEEYLDAGLDEYFHECAEGAAICLVEWPDKAAGYLPPAALRVQLDIVGEAREARLFAASAEGQACLSHGTFCTDSAAAAKP